VRDLVIFTNALPVALELESAIPRFSVVVTGGTLNPLDHALVNPLGNLLLNGIQVDTLFLVADGIDLRGGVTTNSLAQAESKRRMIQVARRRVVIAGSARLRSIQLFSFCTLHEIDILITDRLANPVMVQALQESNVQVILVETDKQIGGGDPC
jgi:DeoR family transcriptional regulator, aga operon transcriptional repressor